MSVDAATFRNQRDAMFTRDISADVAAMPTVALQHALRSEPFIDPFKFLELKRRGVQP